jgi:hypothetical protein
VIQLRKFESERTSWQGNYVWVNHAHITFLSRDASAASTTVTTIGGGLIFVYDTPAEIMEQMPSRESAFTTVTTINDQRKEGR